jgi:hypothetical protein
MALFSAQRRNNLGLVPGSPALFIAKCTGYPFPEQEIEALQREVADRGLSLSDIFGRIAEFEKDPGDYSAYPEDMAWDLEALLQIDGFMLHWLLYNAFEDWTVWVWRAVKFCAAQMFCARTVIFHNDYGEHGNNGKTFAAMCMNVAGLYAQTIKESMMSKASRTPIPRTRRSRLARRTRA